MTVTIASSRGSPTYLKRDLTICASPRRRHCMAVKYPLRMKNSGMRTPARALNR